MAVEIEKAPNIGKVLGRRLRSVGIATQAELLTLGHAAAFRRLTRSFPEEACRHTRLALARAMRGVRWPTLPAALRKQLIAEAGAAGSAGSPSRDPGDAA